MEGNKSIKNLVNEAGGHRYQRVSPTDKRSRVHTSTVTVSVVSNDIKTDERYDMREDKDFRFETFSGQGAGGQARNKNQTCIRMYHIPTGIMETRQGRKLQSNVREAKEALILTLDKKSNNQGAAIQSTIRKRQVGSGQRGDKIRTLRFQDNLVVDHITNKSTTTKKYMRGYMDLLWV